MKKERILRPVTLEILVCIAFFNSISVDTWRKLMTSLFSTSMMALLSALLGSILTIAVGKVLDLVQKRQEQKYTLQKVFFKRKLKIAEAIVSKLQETINLCAPIELIFRKMPDFAAVRNGIFVESGFAQLESNLKVIQQQGDFLAVRLYFDTTKMDRIMSLCYEQFATLLQMFSLLKKEVEVWSDSGDRANQGMAQELQGKFIELISGISSCFKTMITAMDNSIGEIRNEMRVYGP